MIELTTSYQLIKQEYVGNAYGDVYVRCYAKYDERDIPNNRTKVTVASNLVCAGTWWAQSGNEWYAGASGLTTASGTAPSSYSPGEITLGTLTGWISHENDGKKNISVAAGFVSTPWGFAKTASDTVKLPDIPRASKLTSATMSIANNQTTKVVLNMTKSVSTYYDNLIIKDGTTTVATINGVTNGGSGSTLSSAQANAVFNAIGTATSKTFTCYLQTKTSSSGSEVGTSSSVNLVATLPNYSISFTSSTVTDSVTTYEPYKPNTSTFIANLSKPKYEFGASSSTGYYYGRTLGYKIGSTTVTSPYTNNNYTGQSLTITASDGRKSVNSTPSMTHVAYFRPTLTTKVSRTTPTGSTATVTVNGTYYDGTGLTNLETPVVQFAYTESGGTQQTITIPITTSTSGTTISFNGTATLTGLNYKKTISWTTTLTDKLNISTNNTGLVPEGQPLWNGYKKNDINYFNVNGKEIIDSNGNDMILLDNDTSTTDTMIKANAKWANRSLSFGVGAGGNNAGIYDNNRNSWIIRSNNEGGGHFIGTPCDINVFPTLDAGAKWFKLCNIKFDSHLQGKFAYMKIFIASGNNSADNQVAYIELVMQMGWTGNYSGRFGCSAVLHKMNSTLTTSNTKIKVITNSNVNYDIWVYVGVQYCRPCYIVDGPNDIYVTQTTTTSTTEPSGTACSCSYQQI